MAGRQQVVRLISVLGLSLTLGLGLAGSACAEPRTPKVADKFYPGDRAELLDLVSELLKRQPQPVAAKKPRVLIVPHAGYQYSGLVAANGFRQLQGRH